jgi:hypothetical protein
MQTIETKNADLLKRPYSKPMVERIKIDNQISMVMMSTAPSDPESLHSLTPFK